MSDQFLAEIRMFSMNFAPIQWAQCNGGILPISQNTALFSLIGTYYGGNGTSNFQLPNMQGNVPLGAGAGAGLSIYVIGEQGGTPTHSLIEGENATHNHLIVADLEQGNSSKPPGLVNRRGVIPGASVTDIWYYSDQATNATLHPQTLSTTGKSLPHNNMMPYLTINFCIAMQGIFPPRG